MKIKLSSFRLLALFTLSVTLLAFELGIMRLFAVGSWSNFGSMVISICLLGFGLAGTLLRAGLAEPVMDVESFTLTYPDLRDLMRDLKGHNVAQIIISHRLNDIFEVGDRVMVLKRGRAVGERRNSIQVRAALGWGAPRTTAAA